MPKAKSLTLPADLPATPAKCPEERRKAPRLTLSPPRVPEKAVQSAIVETLRLLGYRVLQTGHITKRQKCQSCGAWQWQRGGYGNEPGVGDLLISHDTRWSAQVWIMFEVKGAGTKIRREQRELLDADRSAIVRSPWQAVETLLIVEELMGVDPNPRLREWLRINAKAGQEI